MLMWLAVMADINLANSDITGKVTIIYTWLQIHLRSYKRPLPAVIVDSKLPR
jgi:hypothetical protein